MKKVYTFYFHQGIKFHDGAPFSAEEVKFVLDRIRKPPKGLVSPRQGPLQVIDEVAVVDKNTLKTTFLCGPSLEAEPVA